jgi:UDP-glucose 4-epimerase
MTKILVTGGAGFIGSHLCERLAQDPLNEVVSLDNYFTGSLDNNVPNVRYIIGSTVDIASLIDFIPDMIYHLGEYSRVEQSFDDVDLVLQYNTSSIGSVLSFVRKTGAKLIYAGSSTKFADNTEGYVQSPYAWSKATNTELVKNFGSWYGINYAITYFYNVYGARETNSGKYATLIGKFSERMKLGQTLPVVSPGTQYRNFTHIDDIVDALILIGLYGLGDEYGIGNEKAYSILEVAKLYGGTIEMLPARPGNRMSAPVITEKTKALGWKATRNLETYINSLK